MMFGSFLDQFSLSKAINLVRGWNVAAMKKQLSPVKIYPVQKQQIVTIKTDITSGSTGLPGPYLRGNLSVRRGPGNL
jgi:hypothetical protein